MAQEEADQLSKWVLPRRVCFNYHRCLTLPPAGAAGLCICEDDALFQDDFIRAMLLAVNEMEKEHKILKYILRLFIPFEFSPEQPVPVGNIAQSTTRERSMGTYACTIHQVYYRKSLG